MDKRSFYLGLTIRLFFGFLLAVLTISHWQLQKILLENPLSGWLVFTGMPMFFVFGGVFLIAADILWIINLILWIAIQRSKKDTDEDNVEDEKVVYLP